MKDKPKNPLIKRLLVNFWIVIVVSIVLIIYYSLEKFDILPEGFPVLLFEPKDIVSAALTFIGICIAFNGLNTWQSQLKGKYDFDLACQTMRNISKIRIAYVNFSTMWIFHPICQKYGYSSIRLYIFDGYFQKLNDLRSEINNFRTFINEIKATWDDFPHDYMSKMIIKTNSYLTNAEGFISFCQVNSKIYSSTEKFVSLIVSDPDDEMGKVFLLLCSDSLIKSNKIKLPFTADFRKNYNEFISSYEQTRLFLDKKIKQYISTIE